MHKEKDKKFNYKGDFMDIWACAGTNTILDGVKKPGWLKMMKDSHIKGFFVTSFDVTNAIPIENVAAVKHILDEEGFDMIGIGIPLGHPEGLDTPCYTFHDGWHIRRDINNELVPWCNAITPQLISEGWIIILRNQFHDIIPGSSIKEVYEDSRVEYAKVFEIGNKAFDTALDTVASDIRTEGGLLVYNPTSYTVSDIVKVDGKDTYIENIPAHGYAVVKPTELKNTVVVGDKHIENDLISVTFDENYNIVSIYDKANDREIIKSGEKANVFEIFEDYPREYDAWEITEYYKSKKWTIDNVVNVTEVKGELSGGLCIERKYGNSTFKQNVILRTGSERVDFDTEIDWHENHVLLKAAFPLDIETENVTGEIQFGHLDRPTHYNTSWDEAKFEVCCHKWAELTEEDYGVAILNDCKYGYSAEGNVLKITLLKAPKSPNPEADMGAHKFTYCIYPHTGACRCKTVKEAYILNNPLTVKAIAANANGTLSDNYSFITTNAKGAVTETAKLAEDGNGYIVRVYEAQSIKEKATLTFGFDVKEAYFCDMLENNEEKVEVNGNTIKVPLTNFEIKTIRVIPA